MFTAVIRRTLSEIFKIFHHFMVSIPHFMVSISSFYGEHSSFYGE